MKEELSKLFEKLYWAETENDVDTIISDNPEIFHEENWEPYGGSKNNYSFIDNQQSKPVASLIEKLTNSIDAILMRRCLEEGIDPKSKDAPQSIDEAIQKFFPDNEHWDLSHRRDEQAENIQVIAHGPRNETSLVIYDYGEGQEPEMLPETLLSLGKGNKQKIHFVQGKYNMGGSGAIIFCGDKRYQLIASKRYTGDKPFGFTLVRPHPLNKKEESEYKSTWYEYLTVDGEIPSFPITELDLGLRGRKFTTGTIIKLYSYQLPTGSKSVISRDLNLSLNEHLFEPALPIFTIDNNKRYPKDQNPERSLYGLKRRLDDSSGKYIEETFSEEVSDWGGFKISCYIFKFQVEGKNAKESRGTIRREFFKNNMSVLFSMNGQVHGHFTREFITRALKFNLLQNHLLIHVDCTSLNSNIRNRLFMASRDRLAEGKETQELRAKITEVLKNSRLKEIHHEYRSKLISGDGEETKKILTDFSENLPLTPELTKLLKQTLNIQAKDKSRNKSGAGKKSRSKKEPAPFNGERYPAKFKIQAKQQEDELPLIQIPKGKERTIQFETDVEDSYFDRDDDPGEFKLAFLGYRSNGGGGGGLPQPTEITDLLSVSKASPSKGIIRLHTKARKDIPVGTSIKVQATLTNPGEQDGDFEETFFVKVIDSQKQDKKPKEASEPNIGLPALVEVVEKEGENSNARTWDELEGSGISFDADTIMYPLVEEDKLTHIYINMDSHVLHRFNQKQSNSDQVSIARKHYLTSVYFHTLFLYTTSKKLKFDVKNESGDSVDLSEYLVGLFNESYASFLVNFRISQLLESIED